jgi:RNA polymerase sigma-32 factor
MGKQGNVLRPIASSETPTMTHLPSKLNCPVSVGSLDDYIRYVNQIPVLTQDEEKDLAEKLFNSNDLEAAKSLVLAHLRFVVQIAKRYSGYGLALADLIQEGNIGLMKAVKRFDPQMGVRLVSFAVHWIKAEIHEFILRNWRIVKIATTKVQRKLFFNLRSAKKRLGWFTKEEVDTVAQDLGVTPLQIYDMEKKLSMAAFDVSFDQSSEDDEDNENILRLAPAQYLEGDRLDPAQQLETQNSIDHNQQTLKEGLMSLDARSRDILQKRWLNPEKTTLQTLATEYGVSSQRVQQLEQAAMSKLKAALVPA